MAGPAAEEVGLALQDSIKVWRAKRQYRLFEKMRDFVTEAGYEPRHIPLKVLLPAMDYASVEEDENLHDAWAALLANAADPTFKSGVTSAFPEILRQLEPREGALLDEIIRRAVNYSKSPLTGQLERPLNAVLHYQPDRDCCIGSGVTLGMRSPDVSRWLSHRHQSWLRPVKPMKMQ